MEDITITIAAVDCGQDLGTQRPVAIVDLLIQTREPLPRSSHLDLFCNGLFTATFCDAHPDGTSEYLHAIALLFPDAVCGLHGERRPDQVQFRYMYITMAHIVMAYTVTACIVMPYTVMAYIVMAPPGPGPVSVLEACARLA